MNNYEIREAVAGAQIAEALAKIGAQIDGAAFPIQVSPLVPATFTPGLSKLEWATVTIAAGLVVGPEDLDAARISSIAGDIAEVCLYRARAARSKPPAAELLSADDLNLIGRALRAQAINYAERWSLVAPLLARLQAEAAGNA